MGVPKKKAGGSKSQISLGKSQSGNKQNNSQYEAGKRKVARSTTKSMLIFRMLLGAYFTYLAGSLYSGGALNESTGVKLVLVVIGMILFVGCGITLIVASARSLSKGDYEK